MLAGAVLGCVYATVLGGASSQFQITGDNTTNFLVSAIGSPIVAQMLMLAGPVLLFMIRRRSYREPLDGLTFGAASALGFSLASELTSLWPIITGPLVGSGQPVEWALRLLRLGILLSLVNASTTAVVAAALWLHRYDLNRSQRTWEVHVPVPLLVARGAHVAPPVRPVLPLAPVVLV